MYFAPFRNPRLSDCPEGENLTAQLAEESVRIIDRFKDRPFLLYHAFYSVHTPLQAPRELVRKYEARAAALGAKPEFAPEEQVWPTTEPRQVRAAQSHPTYAAMAGDGQAVGVPRR